MSIVKKKSAGQFLKYNFGGLLYFASAWLIITFGTKYIGLWWANVIGNGVGIVLNYLVQRFWTFASKKNAGAHSNWKYIVLTLLNLVLSYYILKSLVHVGIPLWFAQFISAGFFTGWNWAWYKYWVFKEEQ